MVNELMAYELMVKELMAYELMVKELMAYELMVNELMLKELMINQLILSIKYCWLVYTNLMSFKLSLAWILILQEKSIDFFIRYANSSWVILCQTIRESRSLWFQIYFCVVVS